MQLRGYDYFSDTEDNSKGLAHIGGLIDRARAEQPNCLLFDNGDFLQGTPMSDMISDPASQWPADQPHPAIGAMNALGFDAGTLGNHEFNYGLDHLQFVLEHARHPVISTNVSFVQPLSDNLFQSAILKRTLLDSDGTERHIRIGIIGLVPPQITIWDARHLRGRVAVEPIIDCAKRTAADMRASGVDLIVALCHSGLGHAASLERGEEVGIEVARQANIDALILGHSHQHFPVPDVPSPEPDVDEFAGTIAGIPTVMPGANGTHLGVIDIEIEHKGGAYWVRHARGHLRSVTHAQPKQSAKVLAATQPAHDQTLAYVRKEIGQTSQPLNTYFSALGHDRATALVAAAQARVTEKALRGTDHEGLPILSAAAPFKAGGRGGPKFYTDIQAGALQVRHVADLSPYPNALVAVRINGAQLRNWLERAAGLFSQITSAGNSVPVPLVNNQFPIYNFDVIHGIRYRIDLSVDPLFEPETGKRTHANRHRIVDLTYNGAPVADHMEFVVATNSYRAGGGGSFPDIAQADVAMRTDTTTNEAIASYLSFDTPHDDPFEPVWSFAPLNGARVVFETGPKARNRLEPEFLPEMRDLGDNSAGFALFELTL